MTSQMSTTASAHAVAERSAAVLDEIEKVVVGKRPVLELIMAAVLARAHVLIEDLPGLGKTLIARSFATALGLDFRRVQFTPDLLPADLTGTTVLDGAGEPVSWQPHQRFVAGEAPLYPTGLLALLGAAG